jgi:hypothetical protein
MGRYPDVAAANSFAVEILAEMIPDVYVKASSETRDSTTTLEDDSELAGIPLEVGQYHILVMGFFRSTGSTTPDIKTQWEFSGTWNDPIRLVTAPGPTNTANRDAVTPMYMGAVDTDADAVYGCSASGNPSGFREETYNIIVTVAGDMSFRWAQNTSNATATEVLLGTTVSVRKLAD